MALPTNLVQYPTSLGDAPGIVIDKLRGKEVDNAQLLHAAYHVVGFALGQMFSDGAPVMASAGTKAAPCSPEECADLLESAAKAEASGQKMALGGGWLQVLLTLLPLLEQLLRGQQT